MKKSFWTCYIAIWVSIYRFSRTPSWLARSNCVYHAPVTQPLWNNIITSQFEPLEQKYWYVTLCLWDQGIHWCYLNFIYHTTSHFLHKNLHIWPSRLPILMSSHMFWGSRSSLVLLCFLLSRNLSSQTC